MNQRRRRVSTSIGIVLASATTLVAPVGVQGADGSVLDTAYGAGFQVHDIQGREDSAEVVHLRPDGRIVLGGTSTVPGGSDAQPSFVQLFPNGGADHAWGSLTGAESDGRTVVDLTSSARLVDFAFEPDGGIVAMAATTGAASEQGILFWLDPLGALEDQQPFDMGASFVTERWHDMERLADGGALVTGSVRASGGSSVTAVVRLDAAGVPVPTFGEDGMVTIQLGTADSEANAIALHPGEGRFAIVSRARSGTDFRVAVAERRVSDGTPTAFSGDGKVLTDDPAAGVEGRDIAYGASGRIVVAADRSSSARPLAVVRYLSSGALDDGFAGDGYADYALPGPPSLLSLALSSTGAITVMGDDEGGIAAARILASGPLDTSFSGDGIAQLAPPPRTAFDAMVTDPEGRPLFVATAYQGGEDDLLAGRLTAAGGVDSTFARRQTGTGRGTMLAGDEGDIPPRSSDANGIAIDSNGRALIAGNDDVTGLPRMTVLRLVPAGWRDSTYGDHGRVHLSPSDQPWQGFDVTARGARAVVAGCARCGGESPGAAAESDFAVARATATGGADTTFSGDGRTTVSFGIDLEEYATAVAVDSQGRVLVAGNAADPTNGGGDVAVARLTAAGALDSAFSGDGRVLTNISTIGTTTSIDRVDDIAIDASDRVVVAGARIVAGESRAVVLRYRANGTLDPTFSDDGIFFIAPSFEQSEATGVAIRPDGRILLGFSHFASGASAQLGVQRLLPDGTPDPAWNDGGDARTYVLGAGDEVPVGIASAPDDRIFVGGWTADDGQFLIAKIRPGGSLETAYSVDGWDDARFEPGPADARAMAIDGSGRPYVAGEAAVVDGSYRMAVARWAP